LIRHSGFDDSKGLFEQLVIDGNERDFALLAFGHEPVVESRVSPYHSWAKRMAQSFNSERLKAIKKDNHEGRIRGNIGGSDGLRNFGGDQAQTHEQ
jgi:hypothetical protein